MVRDPYRSTTSDILFSFLGKSTRTSGTTLTRTTLCPGAAPAPAPAPAYGSGGDAPTALQPVYLLRSQLHCGGHSAAEEEDPAARGAGRKAAQKAQDRAAEMQAPGEAAGEN